MWFTFYFYWAIIFFTLIISVLLLHAMTYPFSLYLQLWQCFKLSTRTANCWVLRIFSFDTLLSLMCLPLTYIIFSLRKRWLYIRNWAKNSTGLLCAFNTSHPFNSKVMSVRYPSNNSKPIYLYVCMLIQQFGEITRIH